MVVAIVLAMIYLTGRKKSTGEGSEVHVSSLRKGCYQWFESDSLARAFAFIA